MKGFSYILDIKFTSKARSPLEEYISLINFPILPGPAIVNLCPPRSHNNVFTKRSIYNKFVEANLHSGGKICVLKIETPPSFRSKPTARGSPSPEERTASRKA